MILAIDITGDIGSISIGTKEDVLYSLSFKNIYSHSKYLASIVNNALNILNKQLDDIKDIVVVDGPGSFTGLRISFAYAQGLSIALKLNRYKISRFILPIYFLKKYYPDIKEFYHAISIKKDFFVVAHFFSLNIDDYKIEIYDNNINEINPYIPIIYNKKPSIKLSNPVIEFYSTGNPTTYYAIKTLIENEIKPLNPTEILTPTYYKKSQAEESYYGKETKKN